jgi:hypothetical protein
VAWIALMLVLGFTKLGRLTPWTVWAEPTASREQTAIVTFHYPERLADRVIRTGQFYFIQDLAKPNPGTTARIVEFLDAHAREGDVVITNYGWEPLYFHTRLPLGMTVLPAHPIYAAVRTRGLPEYVSSDEGARWIVWRRAWGDYSGLAVEEVVYNLQAAGVTVTLEETIPETLWENRENVHFRRFAGGRYIYPWFESVGETRIYRLDWPDPKRPSVPRS